jgi:hypothetical protein
MSRKPTMISAAKPLKPLRLNQKAVLIPAAQFAKWHELASAMPGLTEVDREILDVIAERYHQIHAQGFAGRLRIKWMAAHVGAEPMSIRLSLAHLVELAVLGIKPGSGRRPHEYLLALPKRTIAATEAATVESEPAPPF